MSPNGRNAVRRLTYLLKGGTMEEKKPRVFLVSHEVAKRWYRPSTKALEAAEKRDKYLRKKFKLSRNLHKEMRKA